MFNICFLIDPPVCSLLPLDSGKVFSIQVKFQHSKKNPSLLYVTKVDLIEARGFLYHESAYLGAYKQNQLHMS
uniref:Uncharacterized protein n=1 Tax=Arundo donax TaxID=35708 RepID=A0A0A9HRX5_ARUDO